MKEFAAFIQKLEMSNKTNDKINALVNFFENTEEKDKPFVIAMFTGKRPKRPINTALMRTWAIEIADIPGWLFQESYQSVGDLSETIALVLPPPNTEIEKPLYRWIQELNALTNQSEDEKKSYVLNAWNGLNYPERFIFNKLIGGNFRIGVSHKLLVNALAKLMQTDSNKIMHSIMGKWDPNEITFSELMNGAHVNTDSSWPYPFCLAYALETNVDALGIPQDWQAEWKWDGIRGQIIKRNDELFIWSRGEELVTDQFPELHDLLNSLPNGTVLDGEILAVKNRVVLPFSVLQQRLNRKNIQKKQLEEAPIAFFVYDLLENNYEDLRNYPLQTRRKLLEELIQNRKLETPLFISPVIQFSEWTELTEKRAQSRNNKSEGLMLKKKDSFYHSGRKRGDWWKWKVNPYTVDAVLIYAQKGSGRRANFYTDYTFAIQDGEKLITIAKAYSGLTNEEIKEVNTFVNKNSIEKFGPVRTVKPILVFEIAFEGISESKRHKAGLALRFPRIVRWRKDKKANEINTLQDLQQLLKLSLDIH